MPIDLRIVDWESRGLRNPDHKVEFSSGQNEINDISLIQMPTGTGKTTTLLLLRAALSGCAEEWDKRTVRGFQKKGSNKSEGFFKLTLLEGIERYTFNLRFDFEQGKVIYHTTLPGSGMKEGFLPPRKLRKFLQVGFVNFFIFDGELAKQILSPKHTDAQNAIENLFQLVLFSAMGSRIHLFWENASSNTTSRHSRGLARKQNLCNELKARIATLTKEQSETLKAKDEEKKKLIALENKSAERIKKNKKNKGLLQNAHDHLEKAKLKVKELSKSSLKLMQAPHFLTSRFGQQMIDLRANLDKVKLPESAAREFFQELSEEAFCVCGRAIDSDAKNNILENADKYLGSEDVAVLNSIKDGISNLVGKDPTTHEEKLNLEIESLNKAVSVEGQKQTDYDDIKQNAVDDDPELKIIEDEIREYGESLICIDAKLSRYEDNVRGKAIQDTTGIKLLTDELKKAEGDLAEITETVELRDKTEKLNKILARTNELASEKLCNQICEEANERIEKLMPSNDIRIEKIDKSLVLRGQRAGSEGETLTVSYAFLSTLFNRSDHNLPFVVDSPAGPLDGDVRIEVASVVPLLTEQFIGFMLNTERLNFLEPLERSAKNKNMQYTTLFKRGRKGFEDFEEDRKDDQLVEVTCDGVLVKGRDFFVEFNPKMEGQNGV